MAIVSEKERKKKNRRKENPENGLCFFEGFDPMLFTFLPVLLTSF